MLSIEPGAGHFALLIGALFNAHLNRKRDDELRKREARALAVALRAELFAMEIGEMANGSF